jgi:inosose dehydratase
MAKWRLAYHANCWGPLGGHPVGVTSVGQLSYMTFAEMNRAFADIGRAGYAGVEIFDGNLFSYSDDPARLQGLLAENRLQLVAVYCGANFIYPDILNEELEKIRKVAALAARVGTTHLVVGGGAKRLGGPKPGDREKTGAGLEQVAQIAAGNGLQAHYHPHLTTLAETPIEIAQIFEHTSIGFCPDTAHLAAAGGDPASLIRQWANRISYIHLKGLKNDPFGFTPLDEGDLDIGAITDAMDGIGFTGWVAAELDAWPDPFQGAASSHAWLTGRNN